MKKILFYFSLGIAIIILVNIINILVFDLKRLTEYGYGYLLGKTILFLVFVGIAILIKNAGLDSKADKTAHNSEF